jgi:hypothetical protein
MVRSGPIRSCGVGRGRRGTRRRYSRKKNGIAGPDTTNERLAIAFHTSVHAANALRLWLCGGCCVAGQHCVRRLVYSDLFQCGTFYFKICLGVFYQIGSETSGLPGLTKRRKVFVRRKRIRGHRVDVSKDILGVSYSMAVSSVNVPKSRVFRDRAEECRTMAALFHGEKTRALLLRVAADYDCMADRAAMFELQDADREARAIPLGALAQA